MTYKSTQVYVMMREMWNPEDDTKQHEFDPVAVFYDLQTAEGNSEGYNLSMKEQNIPNMKFFVKVTMAYE
jgi:hypothetical protein